MTNLLGDTRLGLMWSCMTLYNRPQICYKPELKPAWWVALVCILVGCILITTTVSLLISSHWDRNVIPYARWVGFTASKTNTYIIIFIKPHSYLDKLQSLSFLQWYYSVLRQLYSQWDFT